MEVLPFVLDAFLRSIYVLLQFWFRNWTNARCVITSALFQWLPSKEDDYIFYL